MDIRYKKRIRLGLMIVGAGIVSLLLILQYLNERNKTVLNPPAASIRKMPEVNDRIRLYGGYDYNPLYLRNPPATERVGTVRGFIKGQNKDTAMVVELDNAISGDSITGVYCVLEVRYVGQSWRDDNPVHIELCDFYPENESWEHRRQGEWVEGAASFEVTSVK